MKNIFLIISMIFFCNCKKSNISYNEIPQKKVEESTIKRKKDTLISISTNIQLYFENFDKDLNLWKNPQLIKNHRDTLKIENWNNDWGSELYVRPSPNKNSIMIDAIIKGEVSVNENEAMHENYTCQIIDIDQAKVLDSFQDECDGEWNSDNEWITNGEIVFIGK